MLIVMLKPRRNNAPVSFGPNGERKYQPIVDETGTYTFECDVAEDIAAMAQFPDTYMLPAPPAVEPKVAMPAVALETAPAVAPETVPAPKPASNARASKRASRLG